MTHAGIQQRCLWRWQADSAQQDAAFREPTPARDHRNKLGNPRGAASAEHAAKRIKKIAAGRFDGTRWQIRMTQFKEKAGKNREMAGLGLYAYPVLMAADILVYKATHVPVGEDQKQHLELARDIAGAFNRRYERDFFPLPEPQIFGSATRVMSLRDGTKKMSKSDSSDYSRINMTDAADTIALKIRRAKTDPEPLSETIAELERRPEADNLIGIYAALSELTREEALTRFAGRNFSTFKEALSELAVEVLGSIGREMGRLMADPGYIDSVLRRGAERAGAIAIPVLREAQAISGLLRP